MTDSPALPVDTYLQAAPLLRAPFARNAVKFKIVRGLNVAAFIDSRTVSERLNAVVGPLWEEGRRAEVINGVLIPAVPPYEPLSSGALRAALTVCGVTRYDVGEPSRVAATKGVYSDAFKRAAVKFGIGVSLHSVPSVVIEGKYTTQIGKSKVITPEGMKHLRDRYDGWLEAFGVPNFGAVLDHGDDDDAVGDAEVEDAGADAPAEDAPAEPEPLTDDAALALVARAEELHSNVPMQAMPKAAFKRQLESARTSMPGLESLVAQLEEMQS